MIIISILLLLLLTFGCDFYICFAVVRHWPIIAKIAIFIPTLLFLFSTFTVMRGNWGWALMLMAGLLLCVMFPKLLFCIFSLIGKIGGLAYNPFAGWLNALGLAVGLIICSCGLYGISFGWKHLVVKNVEIQTSALPDAFKGYRIAQISDLHLGTFGNDVAHIRRLVDKINGLQPDLIVFTGDLVNFTYQEVLPFKDELSRLEAKDGVMSILGNHDYALYAQRHSKDDFVIARQESSRSLVDELISVQREMGWRLLLDESEPISRGNDSIWIAGVQNIGKQFSANRGDLEKTLSTIPDSAFTILLSHDPTHWETAVMGKKNIPLTLSGHTHSMQIRIFGWSPSALIFKRWSGHYQESYDSPEFGKIPQHLYVSPGTGGNLPFRFGAWPEITVLRLE